VLVVAAITRSAAWLGIVDRSLSGVVQQPAPN
jgi:hypothetical protein